MGFLAGWMLNPWLFAAGGLLVAAPILIHLLNRRKFRIVDWAAMDFLLEADQRNRRRVQIEEMILLLLRCAAMLLAGLFVARPFLPSSITRSLFQTDRTERVVLLDDSPSMDAVHAGSSPFRTAKRRIAEFVTALAEEGNGDSLTLCLTSRPDRPIFRDAVVDNRSAAGLVGEVEALAVCDLPARFDQAFVSLRGLVQGKSERINRVGYVLSDLRRSDWTSDEKKGETRAAGESAAAAEALATLSKDLAGCFVVDCGAGPATNVAVTGITPEDKALLSGVTTRFQVTVKNFGSEALRDVPVKFVAGGALPMSATIGAVPPGGTGSVPFSFTFAAAGDDEAAVEPIEMTAEIGSLPGDMLAADNARYFAARVRAGIPTLIVDGDPSGEFGHAESFFLQRALSPPGSSRSGITTEVVNDSDFGGMSLEAFQAIYLCNVYQLDLARVKALEEWVRAGGGLVVFPGAQVDQRFYNEILCQGGKGLLSRPLQSISGDETEKSWAAFAVTQPEHPAVRVFGGDAAPLLESAKVYQWWSVPETGEGTVLLRLADADRSPAMIERRFGAGRVIQFCVPADAEWSNWPEDASYLILLQELNRYLAQTSASPGQIVVGEPLIEPVDLSRYRAEVGLIRPDGATSTLLAVPNGNERGPGTSNQWTVRIDDAITRGFYRFELTTPEGGAEKVLAAASLPGGESELNRIDSSTLQSSWQGAPVELVGPVALAGLTADAARGELWWFVVLILAAVLFAEQGLAWMFGRRR
ncbi:hypothetical protein Pan44_48890 [Caulifigura coniformis]|uniref:Aerotolerance regulator N-terminal domain-containing protein n=1 Tax=Caulifigura coniformis TaxID=2527983 RepID=A0A517SL19_9PLAN|nr:BatA domain-containing protein [Caulifigura coniformis]QDT56829.1 hypothetical protein Pan44_48890 [Caulifigura coniformis]